MHTSVIWGRIVAFIAIVFFSASSNFVALPVAQAFVSNGLVSQWTFDEGSGSVVEDSIGSNTGSLVNNPTWASGMQGSALQFDGTSNYVNVEDSTSLQPSQISVSFWVKRNGAQPDWAKMLMKGSGAAAPWGSYKFEFSGSSDTNFYWMVGFTDNTSGVVSSVTSLADNQWYFVTGTYDGTRVRLFINGNPESYSEVTKTIKYDTTPLTIGAGPGYSFFNGSIDDVRVYNRALSISEVKSIYNGEPTVSPSVAITYPLNNQSIYNPLIVTASAITLPDVAGVQFKLDGNNLSNEDLTVPYSASLTPSSLPIGNHTLSAVMRSTNGATLESANVNVTVTAPQATYSVSSAAIVSPERGFYKYRSTINGTYSNKYTDVRNAGYSLTNLVVRLDNYINQYIPQSFLNQLTSELALARAAGVKVIPVVSYNDGFINGDPNQGSNGSSLSWIQNNISQLGAIWQANSDVILAEEAGYIGAWGEWHTSNTIANDDFVSRGTVLNAMLSALPTSRMVLLRYPLDLFKLHGDPTTEAEAYNGTNGSRVGFYNDSFNSTRDDGGTYTWWGLPGYSIDETKNFVGANSLYTAGGAETEYDTIDVGYPGCATALADLQKLNITFVDADYNLNTIEVWNNQGCFEEINRRLGYRFELQDAYYPTTGLVPGNNFHLQLTIKNSGFASPFNARPVYVVLQNINGQNTYKFTLNTDPRSWKPDITSVVTQDLALPTDMVAGNYKLYLWMPDAATGLQNNPLYSVQLANQNVWNPSSGYNTLATNIIVGDIILPMVSITFPLNNSQVNRNSNVTITANASDNISVQRVEFYVNNSLACTDTTLPYTCVWHVPATGNKNHTLQGRAYDSTGNTASSSLITITAK